MGLEKIDKAISNSGPLIHLAQVGSFGLLRTIKKIYIPQEIFNEVCSSSKAGSIEVRKSKTIAVKNLEFRAKDFAKLLSEKYSLDIGEAASISLAKQENIRLFLTDDMSARVIAEKFGLEPHGTVGIVLRAFRNGVISRQRAVQVTMDLHKKSSLFLTSDLVDYIIKELGK